MGVQGNALDQSRDVPQVVSALKREQFQDTNAGNSWSARLSARCLARICPVHGIATPRHSFEDALLPRRRSLGAQAAEFASLVQDSERLGRSVGGKQMIPTSRPRDMSS